MLAFPVRLSEDDGTVLVTSPDFPELTTFGDDEADALRHAVDAIEEAVAARMTARQDIPPPSRGRRLVRLPTQTSLKILLYGGMRRQGVTKAQLARALNWHAPQVDRLFDVRHASRLDRLDSAFSALGLQLEIGVKPRVGRQG